MTKKTCNSQKYKNEDMLGLWTGIGPIIYMEEIPDLLY